MLIEKTLPVENCTCTIPVQARPEQKNLMMWVRIEELPKDLKLDPNARRADITTKVAKDIMATLREAPENFWKLNSGIQMTARDAEIHDGELVTMSLFDAEDDDDGGISDGVINGGHTYECIKQVLHELKAQHNKASDPASRDEAARRLKAVCSAIVRVEVLTGIERSELADISRARNTGQAVKKYSLQNLKGLYEPIRQVLGPDECERIGFCENDVDLVPGKTYQVIDLIRIMCLFNNLLYDFSKDKHPVVCYSSAGRIVERWETDAGTFAPLVSKLPDIMRLHDEVYLLLCDWQSHQKGRPRNGIEIKEHVLPFTRTKVSHKISTAFIYPILASLRILLTPSCEWKYDPFSFLKASGEALINGLMSFYDEQCKSKPHELGRSQGSWRAMAAEARARFAEQMLAQAQRS